MGKYCKFNTGHLHWWSTIQGRFPYIISIFYFIKVRLYGIWLTDSEIQDHLGKAGVYWEREKQYLNARYNMDDWSTANSLTDTGIYGKHAPILGGAKYTEVNF